MQLLAKFRQLVATNELVLYDRFVSDDFPPIETREITAFHRSSLSLKWCELRDKHLFPKPEKSLDIKCWLIAARGIKEAGKKLDALHLPSDPIADFFLQRGEKLVDAFNARVLRAVHGDKKEANFLERVAEAVSGTVPDGKLKIISTAILVYPEVYNRLGHAPTEDELRKATKARWKKPISNRSWRDVKKEMKSLLQQPGAPPLREDAKLRRKVLRDWERVFGDPSRLNIVADTPRS